MSGERLGDLPRDLFEWGEVGSALIARSVNGQIDTIRSTVTATLAASDETYGPGSQKALTIFEAEVSNMTIYSMVVLFVPRTLYNSTSHAPFEVNFNSYQKSLTPYGGINFEPFIYTTEEDSYCSTYQWLVDGKKVTALPESKIGIVNPLNGMEIQANNLRIDGSRTISLQLRNLISVQAFTIHTHIRGIRNG